MKNDKEFSQAQLEKYIKCIQEMENLAQELTSLCPTFSEVKYIDTDLTLVEFNTEQRNCLFQFDSNAYGHALDRFNDMKWEYIMGKAPVDDYKKKAFAFMEAEYKKPLRERRKSKPIALRPPYLNPCKLPCEGFLRLRFSVLAINYLS